MAQQRDAPAFQEYAASMMARTAYRVMSLEARGLLYTLRLECWVNGSVPSDPLTLARVLGYPAEQIERALIEISPLFRFMDGLIRCPELDDYRAHLNDRRQRQAEGGRAGAAMTNGSRAKRQAADPPGKTRLARESLVKPKPAEQRNTKASNGEAVDDEWTRDFDEYERASRGH